MMPPTNAIEVARCAGRTVSPLRPAGRRPAPRVVDKTGRRI